MVGSSRKAMIRVTVVFLLYFSPSHHEYKTDQPNSTPNTPTISIAKLSHDPKIAQSMPPFPPTKEGGKIAIIKITFSPTNFHQSQIPFSHLLGGLSQFLVHYSFLRIQILFHHPLIISPTFVLLHFHLFPFFLRQSRRWPTFFILADQPFPSPFFKLWSPTTGFDHRRWGRRQKCSRAV
jgi:hypothetical protein